MVNPSTISVSRAKNIYNKTGTVLLEIGSFLNIKKKKKSLFRKLNPENLKT